ncbi:MAG: precorrin-8X methylmutase [Spirochaetia bacterium]|nr:precorrin-8X methylmutase [Spirochaetia bacterium]
MNQDNTFKPVTIQPQEIEQESFRIIDEEIGAHKFSTQEYPVVRRVIHATADFDLGKSLLFHPTAIKSGIDALKKGKNIIADVGMVQTGISKARVEKNGCKVLTYISNPVVIEEAKKLNLTRSIMATRLAVVENPEGIFVIGNAPTALLELIRLIKEDKIRPSLVIGLPVGFVSAAESKEELAKLDIPFITNIGRKGGTPAAVAAFNALSILSEKID